jgi:hypothetical protein
MDYAEFEKFIKKLSDILDGNYSLFDEGFNKKRVYFIFIMIIASGFSLLVFNLSVFTLIFNFFKISIEIQLLILGLLLFYFYNDIIKLDFLDKQDATKGKYSFEVNLLEKFTVTNPIERIPYTKLIRYPLYFGTRLFCPILSLDIEFPHIGKHFVYRNDELNNTIGKYTKKDVGIAFQEFDNKESKSYPLKTIMANEAPVKITTLINQSPKESFPYLYDSEYYSNTKKNPKIKYTVLKILKKPKKIEGMKKEEIDKKTESLGYIFIQLFHGANIKTNYSDKYPSRKQRQREIFSDELFKIEVTRKEIYFILIIGQKDYVKGIETEIETNSRKVQPRAFGIDMIDEK